MKRIDAVIRREKFSKIKKALDKVRCPGMMVFTFHGYGRQGGVTETRGGRPYKIDLMPKVLLTIIVQDEEAPKIIQTIQTGARTGKIGDGKIFVTLVETVRRIRTGEEGLKAI